MPIERVGHPILLFVTVCTAHGRPLLANHAVTSLLRDCWLGARTWTVGRYVVMPDHVHCFCAPGGDVPLVRWVQFWKAMATRRWPRQVRLPIWQRDCWDTQLWLGVGYEEKWEYVRWNPVRHGLVAHPDLWPFQGELSRLEWF